MDYGGKRNKGEKDWASASGQDCDTAGVLPDAKQQEDYQNDK